MAQEKYEVSKPLLEGEILESQKASKRTADSWTSPCNRLWQLLLVFLIVDAILLTVNLLKDHKKALSVYSPANVALQYEITDSWDNGDKSKWSQADTPDEKDAVWDELLKDQNLRFSEYEMRKSQRDFADMGDAMRAVDGDYLGVLSVYHNLHCLNILRIALNPDRYNFSIAEKAEYMQPEHYDHCIDALRADLMCHADLTVYRATWFKSFAELNNRGIRTGSQRKCVVWDNVASWAHKRALPDGGYLVRAGPYEH